jgi:uncharacterized membrane protein
MNRKRFVLYCIIITMLVGGLVGASASAGNIILPAVAVAVGAVLMRDLKSRLNEIVEDERTHRIGEKASRKTLQIAGFSMVLAAQVLIVMGKKGIADVAQAGYALAYAVCFVLVLYTALYGYYNRKYGDDGAVEE